MRESIKPAHRQIQALPSAMRYKKDTKQLTVKTEGIYKSHQKLS